MAGTWAKAGFDLHLDVAGKRVRAGLENALRDAVRTGRLGPGTPLPSSRTLAADLGVARNTVAEAYGQLVAEGWLVARRGAGTRVGDRPPAVEAAATPPPALARPPRYDLRPGTPDLSAFPRAAWLAAARKALAAAPYDALGYYADPRGRPELRSALAEYLARTRGVRVTPDRLVICSGFAQGLSLLCTVLRARGATGLAVEGYVRRRYREAASACGLRPRAVGLDAHGAVIAELGDADAALLTPAHQFPTGVPLAPRRRTEAVAWAEATGGLVIEDDYDGEFRYGRQPLGAVQALAPEHVVYAGTASKALVPGLRLGWLVLPARLVDEVATAKALADGHSSTPDQLTLAELLVSSAYDRHVRRSRIAYRRRRDRLVAELGRRAPHVRVTGIAAGLHALVELPDGRDEDELVARGAEHGLALEGLGAYATERSRHGPALVVGYGTPPEHAFTAALARLVAVLG